MFGINTKEIFQQKITDIIVILFIIQLLAVTFSYIIKWVRPYLKDRASACNQQKPDCAPEYSFFLKNWFKSQNSSTHNGFEAEITDEEFITMFENLKAFIDIADNPSKAILDSTGLMKINMMSDTEFDNALRLGNFLRKMSRSKCSSEAQTNISISPLMKVDHSCPEIVFDDLQTETTIKETDSSDSFLSVCSAKSSSDFKRELEQIINDLELIDGSEKELMDDDKTMKKLQKYLKASLAKADRTESLRQSENPVSQENKLLEVAITEFEKELKPIKDQIQKLKECISGYDLTCNPCNSLPSLFNSSFTESGLISESTGTLSTCCTHDLQTYFSSYHIISTTSFGSSDSDSRYKNLKTLDRIAYLNPPKTKQKLNQCSKHPSVHKLSSKTPEVVSTPERAKSKKRSPIAEMYVKLSQCNSQSYCLVKGKKERLSSNDNTVTYRIDFNVNLAGVSASNCQKTKVMKERTIEPLTSDPDEILVK